MYAIQNFAGKHITIVNERRLPIKVIRPGTTDEMLRQGFVEVKGTRTKDFAGNQFFDVMALWG